MPRGWEYTIKQAANLCSVSTDTVKRRLRSGDLPHAHQLTDSARTWVIPLADLVAATPQRPHAPLRNGDMENRIQLAVAQAESAVHATYARAFQELALEAIRADRRYLTSHPVEGEHGLSPPASSPRRPA